MVDLKYKHSVEKELEKFFILNRKVNEDISELSGVLNKLEEYTLRDGKRIRAVLIVVGYLACGGKNIKEIIKVATSAELLQSFFLIHDDIMDGDDMRRGGLAIHTQYMKRYNERVSENLALMMGNISFCLSLEPLLNSSFNNSRKIAAIKEFMNIAKHTCYGQSLDILGGVKKVDEKYITKIHVNKTSRYTISGPLKLGAILAGADNKILDSFARFGLSLGRAFQVRDDILGAFGNKKKLGKPVGSDFKEGKKTLLVIRANSHYVDKMIGRNLSKKDIKKIREIILASGSLEYSKNLIDRLINSSKEELDNMNIGKEQKCFLSDLADFIGIREY